ncbi:MAG: Zn-dependent membrane protease YugP [Pirellulaceae bacterium]|jgi:Zn-dependent membrane protease YugP
MIFYGIEYLIWISPALILSMLAQLWIRQAYAQTSQVPAQMSGFQAARKLLDAHGLYDVEIGQVPGVMSDHYDPRNKTLGLSRDVYHGRSMAAVGIAAHEAGHALQDAARYLPLVMRNFSVGASWYGTNFSWMLLALGILMAQPVIMLVGIALFGIVVLVQIVNLPVEFDASARAKRELVSLGIINDEELPHVKSMLNAAALTYLAGVLQSPLTLLYYLGKYNRGSH